MKPAATDLSGTGRSTVLDGTLGLQSTTDQVSYPIKPSKHIEGLPVELLLEVFRYVLPPTSLLDPVSSRGADSPWTRAMATKAALARVNHRWHSVTISLLYEEACLRRPDQVRSLADSLRGNPDRFHLLKTVIVDSPADTAEERTIVFSGLTHILTRCTRLRTLIFTDALFSKDVKLKAQNRHPVFLFQDSHEIRRYEIPTPLLDLIESMLSRTLARFEHWPEGGTSSYTRHSMAWPLSRFTNAPHLTSLAIHIDNPAVLDLISLASLEELDLSRDYVVPRDWDRSRYFSSWHLPRLRRLVLPGMTSIHESFLKRFGARITYLEFRDPLNLARRYAGGVLAPPTAHVHLCPALRHLVFQADAAATSLPRLPAAHATLAYVDVWFFSPSGRLLNELLAARAGTLAGGDAPLENVRVLDRALHGVPGLAELFPPWAPAGELPRVHAIPGLSITHAPWGVYRSDLDALFPPAEAPWDAEPDDGEEYGEWDAWARPGPSDEEVDEPEEPTYDGSSEDDAGGLTTESEGEGEGEGPKLVGLTVGDTEPVIG